MQSNDNMILILDLLNNIVYYRVKFCNNSDSETALCEVFLYIEKSTETFDYIVGKTFLTRKW